MQVVQEWGVLFDEILRNGRVRHSKLVVGRKFNNVVAGEGFSLG